MIARKLSYLAIMTWLAMSGLNSAPVCAQPASTEPSAVDGFWLGTLKVASQSLRIQITVATDAGGRGVCTLDSLDQGAMGLSCANVSYSQRSFSFDVPPVKGRWAGKLSDDGKHLSLRNVSDKVISKEIKDSGTVVSLLTKNASNPELFGEEIEFRKEK